MVNDCRDLGCARLAGPIHDQQPAADRLILDGDLDGKKLHMETTYVDASRFLLVNRRFNWIQEVPFNR